MLSIQVSDIKDCMTKLLYGSSFDRFYLVEAGIRMGISYHLDGHLNQDFYDKDTNEGLGREYCLWKEAKPYVYQIIKGKRQPLSFRLVLALPEQSVDYLIRETSSGFRQEDIEGIYLNLRFEPGSLLITTGISWRTFSLDRSLEHLVDEHIGSYLKEQQIY